MNKREGLFCSLIGVLIVIGTVFYIGIANVNALDVTLQDLNGKAVVSLSNIGGDSIYSYEINFEVNGTLGSIANGRFYGSGSDSTYGNATDESNVVSVYGSKLSANGDGSSADWNLFNVTYTGSIGLKSATFVLSNESDLTLTACNSSLITSSGCPVAPNQRPGEENNGNGNGGNGGGSGGGGGGGGASGNVTAAANSRDIKIISSYSELAVSIISNENSTREIQFTNKGSKEYTFIFKLQALGSKTKIDPENVTLKPGETKSVKLTFSGLKDGIIVGKIIIKVGDVEVSNIPVIVNIRSKNFLFDSQISLPFQFKKIVVGEKLTTDISLEEVGSGNEKVDVTANYIIKDFNGRTLYEESETFAVQGSKKYQKQFNTGDLPIGNYVVALEIIYPGAFATSSSIFSVVTSKSLLDNFSPLFQGLIILAIVVVLGLILWFLVIRKHVFLKKMRHVDKK